ncbi:MAG: DUF3853 family protein [Prevotellaceae bacterium]|jgi:hypothetical protein|nr:DUF3853 family protein [Prevotellaceae bacterium]
MTREIDKNTPVYQLSVGDLLQIMEEHTKPAPTTLVNTAAQPEKYVYRLSGIARLFGCSKTTANRIKQSGKINKAITQLGNLIIVDAEKALELAGKANGKYNKNN